MLCISRLAASGLRPGYVADAGAGNTVGADLIRDRDVIVQLLIAHEMRSYGMVWPGWRTAQDWNAVLFPACGSGLRPGYVADAGAGNTVGADLIRDRDVLVQLLIAHEMRSY
jgi:hypothetical protein